MKFHAATAMILFYIFVASSLFTTTDSAKNGLFIISQVWLAAFWVIRAIDNKDQEKKEDKP
jgi:hypothetical protein